MRNDASRWRIPVRICIRAVLLSSFAYLSYLAGAMQERSQLKSAPSPPTHIPAAWNPSADRRDILDTLRSVSARLKTGVQPSPTCRLEEFGTGYGAHKLCARQPGTSCTFYSFGIAGDYSFDVDLAERRSCQGFAADPTVTHSSQLHANVTFHKVAARLLRPDVFPLTTSLPALRKWLGHSRIDVLKMDCEGCEYSLARDVIAEEPAFFDRVDQFTVELHTSKVWMDTEEAVHSLGRLFQLLEASGLVLQYAKIGGCNPKDEVIGCMDMLQEADFPCGIARSCHVYLFARP